MIFKVFKYRIPFSHPLKNSQTTFCYREGVLLQITNNDSRFLAEAAPLPGFSIESIEAVETALRKHFPDLQKIFSSDDVIAKLQAFQKPKNLPTSLSFALDSLGHQIASDQKKQPLTNFLFPNSSSRIAVNTLGDLYSKNPLNDIEQKIAEGYQTFKFKVGMDFDSELQTLRSIRLKFPDISIRLDANQSWNPEVAINNLSLLFPLDIEYCEEPISTPDPAMLQKVSQEIPIPIALDESLLQAENLDEIFSVADFVIIKPTLWGGFKDIMELKNKAVFNDCSVIFTTALETAIGRYLTALLTSGLGAQNYAHGLSTGAFLSDDLIDDRKFLTKGYFDFNNLQPLSELTEDPENYKFLKKLTF